MTIAVNEGLKVTAVGQIAPALAGQGQFNAYPAHLFEKKDPGSKLRGPSRGH